MNWLFKLVPFFIVTVFLLIIAIWIGYGVIAVKTVHALKDCTPAITSKNVDGEQQYSVGCKK